MKPNFTALAAAFLMLGMLAQVHPASGAPTTALVSIDNYAFKAPVLTVRVGAIVTWRNLDDDPHTVTADDGSFDSKGLAQGDTYTHKFAKPGVYHYYCKVHPMMRGTITVKEITS